MPQFSDVNHPFRFQTGRIFTYKLFLEQTHVLLGVTGRFGQIVPSGIYSDSWSQSLRELFLDHCQWEWLFGFENRDKIFDIHRSFKFNPVIVEKGGRTEAIRTAFMRRRLEDWEAAEPLATPYTRAQVERFSPRSKAILEIQSARDLEILEKIYANSVLLGDDGPDGWDVKYKLEFMMNTDAHLFPPRPTWEAQGYRPDEYSRWLKGGWRPIAELWRELKVDPSKVVPIDADCARRIEAPDVQKTDRPGRLRCAQPPYDLLPIPRADIPAGIILSREADQWIRAEGIEDVALPFMQGAMLQQFDFSQKAWVSGTGLRAVWEPIDWSNKFVGPQFLMSVEHAPARPLRTLHRRVARNTDSRMMIAALDAGFPAGDKAPILTTGRPEGDAVLLAVLNSFVFDAVLRNRCGSTNIDLTSLEAMPLPRLDASDRRLIAQVVNQLAGASQLFAPYASVDAGLPWKESWKLTGASRRAAKAAIDAAIASGFGLSAADLRHILDSCDLTEIAHDLPPKGFWRVDAELAPELRHPVLATVAFTDMADAGTPVSRWTLPERVRLSDYGLGHDERAKQALPVASRLGPRFYDWQLGQSAEESWRECEIHARNLDSFGAARSGGAVTSGVAGQAGRTGRDGLF